MMLQVTLVHLYQAGMFADLDQINAEPRTLPGDKSSAAVSSLRGVKVSAAEAPLKEEVAHKLQHLPPALLAKCQQVCVRNNCMMHMHCHMQPCGYADIWKQWTCVAVASEVQRLQHFDGGKALHMCGMLVTVRCCIINVL